MTDLRALLTPIRERLAAATPGPWSHGQGITLYVAKRDWVEKQNQTICHDVRPTDAALIADAPTDLARLLAAIEAVAAVADGWEEDFPHKAWQVRRAIAAALGSDTTNHEGAQ